MFYWAIIIACWQYCISSFGWLKNVRTNWGKSSKKSIRSTFIIIIVVIVIIKYLYLIIFLDRFNKYFFLHWSRGGVLVVFFWVGSEFVFLFFLSLGGIELFLELLCRLYFLLLVLGPFFLLRSREIVSRDLYWNCHHSWYF